MLHGQKMAQKSADAVRPPVSMPLPSKIGNDGRTFAWWQYLKIDTIVVSTLVG